MDAQHVPAWKRLGLRLRYANQNASTTDSKPVDNDHSKKRRRNPSLTDVADSEVQRRQLKRSRVEHQTDQRKLKTSGQDPNTELAGTKVPRRKKSVSFTPETKVEDGDTAQTIQFWVPGSPGSTQKDAVQGSETTRSNVMPKKPKRSKVPKNEKSHPSIIAPRKATAALTYLHQFHHQRSTWKFNKNHDTWILKHALSVEHIPKEHDFALASYVQGLKSTGARQRLVQQSRELLSTASEVREDRSHMRKQLLHALGTEPDGQGDGDDLQIMLKVLTRAELILFSLDESPYGSQAASSLNNQTNPRIKKNKARTSRVEVESSSSSDSETGDESDSSHSASWSHGISGKPTSIGHADESETSSSGSSTDSSTSGDSQSEDQAQGSGSSDSE